MSFRISRGRRRRPSGSTRGYRPGQAVSQILSIFGIGGGKAFAPGLPKDQAVSQLQQNFTPQLLSDPTFKAALTKWMQAAIEPIQAQKENKVYKPSVPLENKDWFGDAINSIGHAVSSVNWGQVAQVGMQAPALCAFTLLADGEGRARG